MTKGLRATLAIVVLVVAVGGAWLAGAFGIDLTGRIDKGLDAAREGNYSEAYWWWRPLADRGNANAQYQIGWLYANGNGLIVDMPRALEWWRKADARGYTDAGFAIGMAYLNGDSATLEADFGAAITWLMRAGDKGSGDARDLLNRLLKTEQKKIFAEHGQVLALSWIGEPIAVTAASVDIKASASAKAKTLAQAGQGETLRRIDERNAWSQVILPDHSGLGWIKTADIRSEVP